jgi:hypothetical protein
MKDLFLWVILPLALAEAVLVGPWISERLLRWGTRWLPDEYQERYVEDWLGELDAVPGSLFKLGFAIRVLLTVPATQRALTGRDALWVLVVKRLLVLATVWLLTVAVAVRRWWRWLGTDPPQAKGDGDSLAPRRLRRSPDESRTRVEDVFYADRRQPRPIWTGDDSDLALLSPPSMSHDETHSVVRTVYQAKGKTAHGTVYGVDELGPDGQVRRYLRFKDDVGREPGQEEPPAP